MKDKAVASSWYPGMDCLVGGGQPSTTRQSEVAFFPPLISAPKRSLGQGNIFTRVCHSVVAGGHAWLWGTCMACRGACVVARGACVVARGHAWLPGGMCGCRGVWLWGGA